MRDPIEKECKYCREWKPVEEYSKTQKYLDGLSKFCKNCIVEIKQKKKRLVTHL